MTPLLNHLLISSQTINPHTPLLLILHQNTYMPFICICMKPILIIHSSMQIPHTIMSMFFKLIWMPTLWPVLQSFGLSLGFKISPCHYYYSECHWPDHPTSIGIWKVPLLGSPDYILVQTFYTPTLPATILLPASIPLETVCHSYTSFANLNGQDCYLTLHGCNDIPDVTFPLQFQHCLLFTHTFQPPSPTTPPSQITECLCQVPSSTLFTIYFSWSTYQTTDFTSVASMTWTYQRMKCIAMQKVYHRFCPLLSLIILILNSLFSTLLTPPDSINFKTSMVGPTTV